MSENYGFVSVNIIKCPKSCNLKGGNALQLFKSILHQLRHQHALLRWEILVAYALEPLGQRMLTAATPELVFAQRIAITRHVVCGSVVMDMGVVLVVQVGEVRPAAAV